MPAHAYDPECDPPCPAFDLTLVEPFTEKRSVVTRGRLDTGADMTVVPAALVAELPLGRFRKVAVQGFRGESETMFTYIVDVSVNGHRIEFVEVVLDESDEAELLVGRDVLNELTVVLDGPALSAEVR